MTFARTKRQALLSILFACGFLALAWREASVWLSNAACYSGWVGLPQYASQLRSVGQRAEIGFWGMMLSLIAAIALGTFAIRHLSNAQPSPIR
jgi:ABC-type phosphate/phosphonate transport system permease subunit